METISNDNTKCLQGRRLRKRFRCAAVVLYFGMAVQSPNLVRAQVSATSAPVSPSPFGTSIPTVVGRSPPPANIVDTPAPATPTPTPGDTTLAPSSTPPTISTDPPFTTTSPTLSPSTSAPFSTTSPTMEVTTQVPIASTEAPSSTPSIAPVTLSPTDAPVVPPTFKPTKRPTKRPTKSPTKVPVTTTSSPTVATPAPTGAITAAPTIATQAPTPETKSPSQSPTLSPSASPSIITEAETASPTAQPSKAGTKPTNPTSKPVKPTVQPTTLDPTFSPTSQPSQNSTSVKPTSSTKSPTASPSRAANTPPTVSVVMLLENTSTILVGTAQQSWTSVTLSFLLQSVQPQLQNLTITLNVTDQHLVRNNRRGRRLQATDAVPLQISFDTFLSYAPTDAYKPEALVGKAFNSVSKRTTYVGMLQRTNDPTFTNVANVQVLVDGSIPAEEDIPTTPQPAPKSKFPTAIVAGAAAAGAFVLIVLVIIFVLCRDRRKEKLKGKPFSYDHTPATTQQQQQSGADRLPMTTEIVMEPQDDISTLGDPMFPGSGGMLMNGMDRDENTASITDDYDYARQYRMAAHQASESSLTRERLESVDDSAKDSSDLSKLGLGKMSESFFSDDASFEEQFVDPDEQFEVMAPAGKLGMVIDTPSGGPPVVHAIKDSSVLADTVQVGDRLLAVDGESTVHMTAMQVSKLISLKANNPTRTLVFRRSRGVSATNLAQ